MPFGFCVILGKLLSLSEMVSSSVKKKKKKNKQLVRLKRIVQIISCTLDKYNMIKALLSLFWFFLIGPSSVAQAGHDFPAPTPECWDYCYLLLSPSDLFRKLVNLPVP